MTMAEAAAALTNALRMAYPETAQDRRRRATLKWLMESCRADGLPPHLELLVVKRAYEDIARGDFPLVEVEPE